MVSTWVRECETVFVGAKGESKGFWAVFSTHGEGYRQTNAAYGFLCSQLFLRSG